MDKFKFSHEDVWDMSKISFCLISALRSINKKGVSAAGPLSPVMNYEV